MLNPTPDLKTLGTLPGAEDKLQSAMSKRNLMLTNAGVRLAHGIGGLLSPAAMGKLQLAALRAAN